MKIPGPTYHVLDNGMSQGDTAILVFTRSLEEEFAQKSAELGLNSSQFASVYNTLIKKTLKTVGKLSLPTYVFDTQLQQGSNFGERISHSIRKVFDKGYQRVIVVGNDCSDLESSHIKKAIKRLEGGRSVLGPDLRGGVYLIGINRDEFDADSFANFPWQKTDLYTALSAALGECYALPPKRDFNSLRDIRLTKVHLAFAVRQIIDRLENWLSNAADTAFAIPNTHAHGHLTCSGRRGPPEILVTH